MNISMSLPNDIDEPHFYCLYKDTMAALDPSSQEDRGKSIIMRTAVAIANASRSDSKMTIQWLSDIQKLGIQRLFLSPKHTRKHEAGDTTFD